jgi:hypothetical protein
MNKMRNVDFTCNECSLKSSAYRSIMRTDPKFCSNTCRLKSARGKYKTFNWDVALEQERIDHLKKYFEKNVIRTNGCWDWKTKGSGDKYPRLDPCRNLPKIQLNRFSWKLHFGDIPAGMNVCHKCDNTRCSNPDHLFLGTTLDNIKDKISKKRHPFGKTHGMAKLDDIKVKEIKKLLSIGVTMTRIAKDFKVNIGTISKIKLNKTWKHLN